MYANASRSARFMWLFSSLALVCCALFSCAKGGGQSSDVDADLGDDAMQAVVDAALPDGPLADACVPAVEELCDGVDDDCDGMVDEGFDVGSPCDGDDTDLCTDDVTVCAEDGLDVDCSNLGSDLLDVCNGVDDDCNAATADGSQDPNTGTSCDGSDSDLCLEGTYVCSGGSLSCSDNTSSTTDICNGVDDDCDALSADGSEDPSVGGLCDGPDGDLCTEGTMVCSSGMVTCSDSTTTTVDLCNGVDDDCDPSSADGSEDPMNNIACDGMDTDLCIEGTTSCNGGVLACSDTSGSTVDLCNGIDDDCDASSTDGSEDPGVGAACDGPDADLCEEGVMACVTASISCTDTGGNNVELCNGLDDDCNSAVDEGIVVDTNPVCSAAPSLGVVSGDLGPETLLASDREERWYRFTIREDNFGATPAYLSARVSLSSAPGTDFDLFVYCLNCGGSLAGQSTNSAGLVDFVDIRRDDGPSNESFDVLVEVRFSSANICADWDLNITSDNAVATENCP